MLNFLSIQNVVLIEKAEINFARGLCAISGETGAGKSILLDALGLAIGFRSNLRLIGSNENKAQVLAEFDISKNQNCQKILQENDLLDGENPNLARIRRIIFENSASKVYVNDVAIGVNLLAKIGETLVEIHGQHDQGGLLNVDSHAQILDEFSQNENLLKNLKKIYEELKNTEEKIAQIKAKKEQTQREKDYLEYVVQELENANVKHDEENELISKKDRLIGKEKVLNYLSELKSRLLEANSQLILGQKTLIRNSNLIEKVLPKEKENFQNISEEIDEQNSKLDISISNIEQLIRDIINSENNLEEIEERLFFIRSLARKFNVQVSELPQVILTSQQKLKLIFFEEKTASDLENEAFRLSQEYQKISDELSARRKKSALILAKKVEEELVFLKMAGTKFLADIAKTQNNTPNGQDKIRFLAAINNDNFDDISKIASGGELSRFMLALKVALIDVKSVPTIIFDEIDTGIGGSTADAVGKRLKILSKTLQVFVVTHQPQIAAKADENFKISKILHDKKIRTTIEKLNEKNRQNEIARMLSGDIITQEALAVAFRLIGDS